MDSDNNYPKYVQLYYIYIYGQFGSNLQQDAAEFLLYFFDAINEELTNVKNVTPDKQPDVVDIDQPTQQQEDNSDSESGSDKEEEETPQNS